jgi:hypothetical protein
MCGCSESVIGFAFDGMWQAEWMDVEWSGDGFVWFLKWIAQFFILKYFFHRSRPTPCSSRLYCLLKSIFVPTVQYFSLMNKSAKKYIFDLTMVDKLFERCKKWFDPH